GFTNKRASQAELVLVEAGDLTRKPEKVSWEVAGGLYVAGVTAWGAVHAVQPKEGETIVISGAAGGVGSLAVQLARRTGATVIGLASERNHEWLKSHGVTPVAYGDGVADRIRSAAPGGVDAFIDTYGDGYVELALALGVAAGRIDTIADYAAAAKHGVKTDGGAEAGPGAQVLAELAGLIADGHLEVPIANVYPLAQVREAYTELERRHTRGKIVLRPYAPLSNEEVSGQIKLSRLCWRQPVADEPVEFASGYDTPSVGVRCSDRVELGYGVAGQGQGRAGDVLAQVG